MMNNGYPAWVVGSGMVTSMAMTGWHDLIAQDVEELFATVTNCHFSCKPHMIWWKGWQKLYATWAMRPTNQLGCFLYKRVQWLVIRIEKLSLSSSPFQIVNKYHEFQKGTGLLHPAKPNSLPAYSWKTMVFFYYGIPSTNLGLVEKVIPYQDEDLPLTSQQGPFSSKPWSYGGSVSGSETCTGWEDQELPPWDCSSNLSGVQELESINGIRFGAWGWCLSIS